MIKPILLFLFFFSGLAGAQTPELKVGDILLQPLKCWACSLIEAEEETIFSHVGIVLEVNPEIKVAEAFGKVRLVSLKEFDAKTEPGQNLAVLRFRNDRIQREFDRSSALLLHYYQTEFHGRKYDHDFRWNNFDEEGEEKFYCSELISKLIKRYIQVDLPIKRMHFQTNREAWINYFRGNVPDGLWGNSPGDFERSELFYQVGEL